MLFRSTFLLVGEDQVPLARAMVESVRKVMPHCNIVQQSDMGTTAVVEDVRRLEWDGLHLMTYRLKHLATLPSADYLILDTDILVQKDVSDVFKQPFDVALTRRTGTIMWRGMDIAKAMPYNTGVMFSRSAKFWAECYEWCSKAQDELQNWFGDQMSVRAIADKKKYVLLELPCGVYNYTPSSVIEDVSDRAIVHYKGAAGRKQWMLDRWEKERRRHK